MVSLKVSGVLILAHLATLLVLSSAQGDMCGAAAPDPAKTCISVRLPWNPMPMYFCTEKSKFRYRNQCQNRFQNQCGMDNLRQDTLMVASPWDCCPLVSYPDSCVHQQCPPAPHGRTCQTMEPNPSQPWECCNSYFCEENVTPETCHFKRLEPSCNMPPKDKMNCVAFVDPFGCCPKFQCDGEGRPGHCPAQVEAMNFEKRFNSSNNMMMMMGPGHPMMMGPPMAMGPANVAAGVSSPAGQAEMQVEAKPADAPAERDNNGVFAYPQRPYAAAAAVAGAGAGAGVRDVGAAMNVKTSSAGFFPMPMHNNNNMQCVGDFNCPGTTKCCSHDMNVYVKDGQWVFRNRNPTYGYCLEPAMMSAAPTKSQKVNEM